MNNQPLTIKYLDKILFAIAGIYLVVVVALLSQGKLGSLQSQNQAVVQQKPISAEDAEFIAYLEKSLENLEDSDRKSRTVQNPPQTNNPQVAAVVKVPSNAIPNPPAPQTPSNSKVIERIYVPVYPQNAPPPTVAVPPAYAKLPPAPPLPPGSATLPTIAPPVTNLGYTLKGFLEASDRSYALFEINGVTKRFEPGENIGSTGWQFRGVANNQVILSGHGKTRILEAGQKF